jgi:hypothetical protein
VEAPHYNSDVQTNLCALCDRPWAVSRAADGRTASVMAPK